ncbi:MAG: TIGR00159 family protein [Armatimonadetes bacterium]|nr:TIGR00159 family protein [Armatimonadota bacterium]
MNIGVPVRIWDLVDVAIVAGIVYRLLLLIRGTRAVQLVQGMVVLFLVYGAAAHFRLHALQAILGYLGAFVPVALLVLFQPELRRILQQIGRARFIQIPSAQLDRNAVTTLAGDLARTAGVLAQRPIGALIVLERETGLTEFSETGVPIDAVLTSQLIINIFFPNTPLHDGAVIVQGNRVMAAGCLLPMTESSQISHTLGTRHRAAIGITEQTDALAIVVSEETGTISVAREGALTRGVTEEELKNLIVGLLLRASSRTSMAWPWRRMA